jgi:hypothetical protein
MWPLKALQIPFCMGSLGAMKCSSIRLALPSKEHAALSEKALNQHL